MMTWGMKILQVFISFFKIGSIAFGGGYAMLPIIMSEVVGNRGWLSQQEFLNIVSISQVTPGPIAINSATYVGYKVSGILGSTAATIGVVSFSIFITTLLSTKLMQHRESPKLQMVFKTLNPMVLALIVSAGIGTAKYVRMEWGSLVIVAISIVWLSFVKGKSHWLMIACGALGFIFFR